MSTRFKCVDWLSGAGIYEVNIRQYTPEGTLKALEKHLPRIRKMGIDILWFMPLTPISMKGRKGTLGSYYACSNYMDINPEFGTVDDFKRLVAQAHSLGFKVIIDWVANHTGLDHTWTQHPDWYLRDDQGNFIETHGWDDVIDLNYQNADMQSAMIHAMKYWIGMFDIDGFRCDMAHLVPLSFWQKARTDCEQLKHLLFLGECDEDSYSSVFDITYAWRWMHDSEKLKSETELPASIQHLKATLEHYGSLPKGSDKLLFTSNHDENSWNGTEFEKYGALAPVLAAFTFLYPAIPLVYSGQEIPNHKRLQFFDKDQLDWPIPPKRPELESFYEVLLDLHRLPAFKTDSRVQWLTNIQNSNEEGDCVMGYFLNWTEDPGHPEQSGTAGSRALVLFNFSCEKSQLFSCAQPLYPDALNGSFTHMDQRLQSSSGHILTPDQQWVLPPSSFSIYYSEAVQKGF